MKLIKIVISLLIFVACYMPLIFVNNIHAGKKRIQRKLQYQEDPYVYLVIMNCRGQRVGVQQFLYSHIKDRLYSVDQLATGKERSKFLRLRYPGFDSDSD